MGVLEFRGPLLRLPAPMSSLAAGGRGSAGICGLRRVRTFRSLAGAPVGSSMAAQARPITKTADRIQYGLIAFLATGS